MQSADGVSVHSAVPERVGGRILSKGKLGYDDQMTTAGQFIAELQRERRSGSVSSETEQHLKHEFRRLGRKAMDAAFATAIGLEVDRLEREAATLRRLRTELFRTG
jgi:hypothetical protein